MPRHRLSIGAFIIALLAVVGGLLVTADALTSAPPADQRMVVLKAKNVSRL